MKDIDVSDTTLIPSPKCLAIGIYAITPTFSTSSFDAALAGGKPPAGFCLDDFRRHFDIISFDAVGHILALLYAMALPPAPRCHMICADISRWRLPSLRGMSRYAAIDVLDEMVAGSRTHLFSLIVPASSLLYFDDEEICDIDSRRRHAGLLRPLSR